MANACNIIEDVSANLCLFGGDLNTNLNSFSPHAMVIKEFLNTYKMSIVVPTNSSDNDYYTFANDKLSNYSTIDFLCVSESLIKGVGYYDVLHDGTNHSDHLPVATSFALPIQSDLNAYVNNGREPVNSHSGHACENGVKSLRWDRVDCNRYYNMSRDLIYPIYNEVIERLSLNEQLMNEEIEQVYAALVNALILAADQCIPSMPQNTLKHWWNSDLTKLKKQSIESHNLWLTSGKPKCGPIFDSKNKNKLLYKLAIKKEKIQSDGRISDQLQESLLLKNSINFWKTWKTKVCNKYNSKIRLEDNLSSSEAADKFANFFQKVNSPNSVQFDVEKREKLKTKLKWYKGDMLSYRHYFNAEIVAISLGKMESGKSPGFDNITVDHLLHCHPVIFPLLAKLYNAMLQNGYVPLDFGKGITIPIPKNENLQGMQSIESFRGITLSSILAKLFEHCILLIFSDYLTTSAISLVSNLKLVVHMLFTQLEK